MTIGPITSLLPPSPSTGTGSQTTAPGDTTETDETTGGSTDTGGSGDTGSSTETGGSGSTSSGDGDASSGAANSSSGGASTSGAASGAADPAVSEPLVPLDARATSAAAQLAEARLLAEQSQDATRSQLIVDAVTETAEKGASTPEDAGPDASSAGDQTQRDRFKAELDTVRGFSAPERSSGVDFRS